LTNGGSLFITKKCFKLGFRVYYYCDIYELVDEYFSIVKDQLYSDIIDYFSSFYNRDVVKCDGFKIVDLSVAFVARANLYDCYCRYIDYKFLEVLGV